ncbi:conserved hypothetical protein [Vibrio owensii]|uniref:hypothetical protein n=1 Tax=Vibrio owensii TaxID=696485 RepID=UPI00289626A2|nr:conserved hypothetical protein [Vibrio owensii]
MPRKVNKRKKKPAIKNQGKIKVLPEYYQIVWSEIHDRYHEELKKCAIEFPKEYRNRVLFSIEEQFNVSSLDEKYNILKRTLIEIESELKRVVSKHSVFYWLHVYRRIAPYLADDLGNNTSEETVIVVRGYLEQAIYKYGSLKKSDDYSVSTEVEFSDILGGYLLNIMKKNLTKEEVKRYADLLSKSNQLVLTEFSEATIFDIYYLEGIAYQYWYVLAKMRALGKGIDATITSDGYINENRSDEQDLLITSFDKRNVDNSASFGMTTNVGTLVKSELGETNNTIFCALLNPLRYKISDLGINPNGYDFSPNFLPFFVNVDLFYDSHKYLEKKFKRKFGFGLLELCQIIFVLSHIAISRTDHKTHKQDSRKGNEWLKIYSKLQRGYHVYPLSYEELLGLISDCVREYKEDGVIKTSNVESDLNDILNFIILDESKQNNLGVWSNGPKPILSECDGMYIFDYSSIYYFLNNIFFGLRHYDSANKKGFEFEDSLCDLAKNNGFNVILNSDVVKTDTQKREVDVGIRIEDKLYLFECKCFERPLDFDIGEPRTINHRIQELDKKLDQADTLRDFIIKNPIGNNYDFSWAKEVHSYVVSSYTEWIWSHDQRLWNSCQNVPRILSAYEVISLLKSEKV